LTTIARTKGVDICFITRFVRMKRTLYCEIPVLHQLPNGLQSGDGVKITLLSYEELGKYSDLNYKYETKLIAHKGLLYFVIPQNIIGYYELKFRKKLGQNLNSYTIEKDIFRILILQIK